MEKFNVKAARLPIDFSAAKDGDYEALAHACRGRDIGVLGLSIIDCDSNTFCRLLIFFDFLQLQ